MATKLLPGKAYGHIAHLPGSRLGPGDHHVNPGQARICTERERDKHDLITVTEKLDGSCVAVVCDEAGNLRAVNRAGYLAVTSLYEQHRLFAAWVSENYARFASILIPGDRLVGEWLAQAHGTRYQLQHEPFVALDLMYSDTRRPYWEFQQLMSSRFTTPHVLHSPGPLSTEGALELLGEHGHHGAIDPAEGAVWRVERNGHLDYMAKLVRPGKVDGCYLPDVTGQDAVWNWHPRLGVGQHA